MIHFCGWDLKELSKSDGNVIAKVIHNKLVTTVPLWFFAITAIYFRWQATPRFLCLALVYSSYSWWYIAFVKIYHLLTEIQTIQRHLRLIFTVIMCCSMSRRKYLAWLVSFPQKSKQPQNGKKKGALFWMMITRLYIVVVVVVETVRENMKNIDQLRLWSRKQELNGIPLFTPRAWSWVGASSGYFLPPCGRFHHPFVAKRQWHSSRCFTPFNFTIKTMPNFTWNYTTRSYKS